MIRSLLMKGALAGALSLSTLSVQAAELKVMLDWFINPDHGPLYVAEERGYFKDAGLEVVFCLLYTSPSPRDTLLSRMPSSA